MKNDHHRILHEFKKYSKRRILLTILFLFLLLLFSAYALSCGSFTIGVKNIINTLAGMGSRTETTLLWKIRIPRVISAIIAGMCLSVCGAVMQCALKNPLASPYTMGISQGAAFGAAFAIIIFNAGDTARSGMPIIINNPYTISLFAFIGSFLSIILILSLAKIKELEPKSVILAGVAIGSLFSAGTMLLQYFADDIKVSSIVFWTFGDIGRASLKETAIMTVCGIIFLIYFIIKKFDFNSLILGDNNAKSLGINVARFRFLAIMFCAFITSLTVSFLGIIGFVGLVAPHIARILIGNDYRYVIPFSALLGALLLLVADTAARTLLAPVILPVGILTSFLGAPVFISLLISKKA